MNHAAQQAKKESALVRWVDLNEPGYRLVVANFPSGARKLVIVGPAEMPPQRERVLREIGFYRTSRSGILVRDALQFSLGMIRRAFPQAGVAELPSTLVKRIQVPGAGGEAEEWAVEINNAVMSVVPIGRNFRGEDVYEGEDGRFVVTEKGERIRASESNEVSAVFLYAFTPEDMALCADAFVAEISRGKNFLFADLARFASLVTGTPEADIEQSDVLHDVQEAIEAAVVRAMRDSVNAADQTAFEVARRIDEGQPPLVARTSASVLLQQYSTPMPISIAAQSILGDVAGKTVLEPTVGNGALLCTLKGARITACDLDETRLGNTARNFRDAKVHQADATEVDFRALNDGEGFDAVIANPPFGGLSKSRVIEGVKIARIDHLILLRSLLARKPDGVGVFIVGADSYVDAKAGQVTGGSRYLFNWLADHYEVDVVEVDGHLYAKQGATFPIRIVVVGRAGKGGAQVPDKLPVIRSHEELWMWAMQMRAKYGHGASVVGALPASNEGGDTDQQSVPEREGNSFQSPYRAFSKVSEATTMVPRNLATPIMLALEDVVAEHGDIDEFVARELRWSVEELGRYLSPEQVDAVALALHANMRGRGFLEGDNTGVGKGRVLAALARHAVLNGRRVVFLTENGTLFTDFWRDIRHIGSEHLFKPFILNDGMAAYDPITGKTVIPSTPKSVVARALESNGLDESYNLVFATYSQFNRDPVTSAKARWLSHVAEGAALLLDESHNAAGDSNTSQNIARALNGCHTVVYSSATSIKDCSNVQIYWKILPASVDVAALPDTLKAGGEPLQEVLSAMLARDGVFIRRENDISHLTIRTVFPDEATTERNRDYADRLSRILELMNFLGGDLAKLVTERNKEIRAMLEKIPAEERRGNRMGATCINFGSRLSAIYRQFLMALKVDTAVERAIAALESGKKPVITLQNTMESLLAEVALDTDDPEAAQADGEIELGAGLTFKDVLHRTLDRLTYYRETDRYGKVDRVPIRSEEALRTVAVIREEINAFPDLPISPLDTIRARLAEAGFVCDELSGRTFQIVERDGRFVATIKPQRPKAQIVRDFNAGTTDAILLTLAGSTGISLHASKEFADQRQRVLIELQPAADVNKRLQFFGRVDRRGQTSAPEIEILATGLPGEARLIAMQNTKLRKLSANTTSNQENAALDKNIPDFLNVVGNEVAYRFLEANPELAQRLDIDIASDEKEDRRVENEHINRLTARLVMLPVNEQEQIYEALTGEYTRVVAELDAKGINPLKSKELDVGARVICKEVFEAGVPGSCSWFHEPVYLKTIEYDVIMRPMRSIDVLEAITGGEAWIRTCALNVQGLENEAFFAWLRSMLSANRHVFLKSVLKEHQDVEAALSASSPNAVQKMQSRLQTLEEILSRLKVGAVIRMRDDDAERPVLGIVTRVLVPERTRHVHLLGQYELAIALPGKERPIVRTLYGLAADELFCVMPDSVKSTLLRQFDEAPAGTMKATRLILDGNLFKAAQIAAQQSLGTSIVYTDEQGNRHRGVLLRSSIRREHLDKLPIRIESPEICRQVFEEQPDIVLTGGGWRDDETVRLTVDGPTAVLEVPGTKSRGGRFFMNRDLIALTGEFNGTRQTMVARFPVTELERVYAVLLRLGASLYADASYRGMINRLTEAAYINKSCDIEEAESRMAVA